MKSKSVRSIKPLFALVVLGSLVGASAHANDGKLCKAKPQLCKKLNKMAKEVAK